MAYRQPRPHHRHGSLPRLFKSHRLLGRAPRARQRHNHQRRRRVGLTSWPTAGRAHIECTLRIERRQRALGPHLYDALYGTDVIAEDGGAAKGPGYNEVRGAKVIAFARNVLDQSAPLVSGSHANSTGYTVVDGVLHVSLNGEGTTTLANPATFVGYQGEAATPSSVLFKHNGNHLDLRIDRTTSIGATDSAGVSDLIMESALSTIPRPGRLGCSGRRRRQGVGLCQLAGHFARHIDRRSR